MRTDSTSLAAGLLTLLGFAAYAFLRDTYVTGSDSYGYYSLALLFDQGRMTLPVGLDAARFPAVAPLGYVAKGATVLPTYSPALPFVMMLLRPLGLEFFVTPFAGALSTLLLFVLARRFVRPRTALFFAALWAVSPVVVWASSRVMTDVVAACFALGVLLLYGRERFVWVGVVVGLSLALRPTNALMFVVVVGALCLRPRELLRFGMGFAIGVAPIALYDTIQFGSPIKTGYGNTVSDFRAESFPHHAVYYLTHTLLHLSPLAALALVPALGEWRRHAFLAVFFATFFFFFAFYRPGADIWWYTRYLLPGFPALMVLAAIGSETVWSALEARSATLRAASTPAALVVAAAALAGLLAYGQAKHVFEPTDGGSQARASLVAREALPPDAVVGALEVSGSFRLYGGLETFRWDLATAVDLVDQLLAEGRPVYVVIEPWNHEHRRLLELREKFSLERVLRLDLWADTYLWRVTGERSDRRS